MSSAMTPSVEQPTGHDVTMAPSSSVEQPPGHDVTMAPSSSASKKKFSCGQGRCCYSSDRKNNVERHRKNACKRIPREEIMEQKLQERTCPLCGQLLMVSKQVKKHQLTKYCKKNREKKQQGVPVEEYQYKYSE